MNTSLVQSAAAHTRRVLENTKQRYRALRGHFPAVDKDGVGPTDDAATAGLKPLAAIISKTI